MIKFVTGAALAAALLALPSSASAAAPFDCGTRGFDFGRVTVKVAGKTSCPMGWASYRKFRRLTLRLGGYPRVMRVKSPVTGKRYRLVQTDMRINRAETRGRMRYQNSGSVDVRFKWRAY